MHAAVVVRASEATPAASAPSSALAVPAQVSAADSSIAGAIESQQSGKKGSASSWNAKAAGGVGNEGEDYLYEVGRSDVSMNVDTAQNSVHLDSLFTGNFLGHKSDIADGSLRGFEFRKFDHIIGKDRSNAILINLPDSNCFTFCEITKHLTRYHAICCRRLLHLSTFPQRRDCALFLLAPSALRWSLNQMRFWSRCGPMR